MAPVPKSHFRSLLCVYHKDKQGGLQSLQQFDLLERILEAISRGERCISTHFCSPGDLKRLKQMGLGTETELDLVVEFPWDVRSLLAVVAQANDTQLRRQVLAMAVARIRKTANLKSILALKGIESCTVRENPYLGPGHAPYENFIESLLKITDTSTDPAEEKLFELFLKSAADEVDETTLMCLEQRGLRTVFHGTNHAVMDDILKSGLDPNFRGPGCRAFDFFGLDYRTSLRYTTLKTPIPHPNYPKLLVFLIIVKPGSRLVSSSGTIALVESNKFQLPLAEITLSTYRLAEHLSNSMNVLARSFFLHV